jgi:hypothetical protein
MFHSIFDPHLGRYTPAGASRYLFVGLNTCETVASSVFYNMQEILQSLVLALYRKSGLS